MKKIIAVLMIAVTLLGVTALPEINDNQVYAAKPNGGMNDPPISNG
ncbi:hypothetical protein RB620_13470 [Paenibacillus sp. LHD-117]|nr:hypothetical protein [Paenibacillus sp. LHD-117]MDQ6420448.1 hypothetical protein [Paenibacillus sp. LHD-117]